MDACSHRLVNTSDLGSLPVVHHSRLFRGPVSHVAFSPCGVYLAVAAAATGRVALLKVAAAGEQVQLLGYVNAEGELCAACSSA
jgi:6-phosphogluconolactonase (cycloisomerase 2 family)